METIDWPDGPSQTYININAQTPDGERLPWAIAVDDDHQSFGKHSGRLDADAARQLAFAHYAMGDALSRAAFALEKKLGGEEGGNDKPAAPKLAEPRQA